MRLHREKTIGDTLINRLIHFDNGTSWRLVEKMSEKTWEGFLPGDDEGEWHPYEAQACYPARQMDARRLCRVHPDGAITGRATRLLWVLAT